MTTFSPHDYFRKEFSISTCWFEEKPVITQLFSRGMDDRNVACYLHSCPKFLWTLDKMPSAVHDLEVISRGRSFSIFRGQGVNLGGSASTLCSDGGREWWVEKKTICWQKCKVFWQGLYMHGFPVAISPVDVVAARL